MQLTTPIKLYGPLFQLGYMYRSLNTSLVDTERLLLLLEEPTEVNDKPGAPDLIVNDGEIEFGSSESNFGLVISGLLMTVLLFVHFRKCVVLIR